MMSVEDRAPKKARTEEELITFSEDGAQHVRFPHSDPLVVDVQVSKMMVKRVLVDTGSSVNILYKSSLERMKLPVKDLEPCNQTIYGFSEEGHAPARSIRLPITAGTTPTNRTLLTTFIVVDCPLAYNAVIGRPILVDLRAVTSIWHLAMKFPTDAGIGCVLRNQREARECYNTSITKAKKGVSREVSGKELQMAIDVQAQSGDNVTK